MILRRAHDPLAARRDGFTLIELLVVVGIIALLIGIAVPATMRARKAAQAAATKAQIGNIATALETYAGNFDGNYPPSTLAANGFNSFSGWSASSVGSQLLAEALMGWMPAANDGGGVGTNGIPGDPSNFGFRTKGVGINAVGTLYGPYMPNSPKVYDAVNNVFVDSNGYPIYYYRATPQINANGTTFTPTVVFGTGGTQKFTSSDNPVAPRDPVTGTIGTPLDPSTAGTGNAGLVSFRQLMGNAKGDNTIATSDNIMPKNYLLVAPDSTGIYFNADGLINESR
jgi:prepilin-type N-terminal cleavage/methylation domain-containing protein